MSMSRRPNFTDGNLIQGGPGIHFSNCCVLGTDENNKDCGTATLDLAVVVIAGTDSEGKALRSDFGDLCAKAQPS